MNSISILPIPPAILAIIDRIDRAGDLTLLPGADTPTERYDDLMRDLFPGYQLRNLTDFQHGRAWQYLIGLTDHPDAVSLDRVRHSQLVHTLGGLDSVFVDISAIAPYVRFRFVRYQFAGDTAQARWSDTPQGADQHVVSTRIMLRLADEGFVRLSPGVADICVPDVQTELCDVGEATVGSCLFYG